MHTWINQNTQNVNYASKQFAHDNSIKSDLFLHREPNLLINVYSNLNE